MFELPVFPIELPAPYEVSATRVFPLLVAGVTGWKIRRVTLPVSGTALMVMYPKGYVLTCEDMSVSEYLPEREAKFVLSVPGKLRVKLSLKKEFDNNCSIYKGQ